MTEQSIILNRLLDKFENSKHFSAPGTSIRRVMLRVEKKDLPEYRYEDAAVRDSYNDAARILEKQHLVQLEWVKERPLLSSIVLNLDQVMQCYAAVGRIHPGIRAKYISSFIYSELEGITVPWIVSWKMDVCSAADKHLKVPAFCKDDDAPLKDLLCTFREYAALSGSITMRAFSSKCFSDTKYFERNVRDLFLRIARKYNTELSLFCEEHALGEKEQLAFLGIYARPELYELTGNCIICTKRGDIYADAATPFGLGLPSVLIDSIVKIDLNAVNCVTFIENKTSYDEYIVSERKPDELVVYHGGYLSPQKRKLFSLITSAAPVSVKMQFWADIDMGGFQMFRQLQKLIPALEPLRMSGEFVDEFCQNGLKRSEEYLSKLQIKAQNGEYPLFCDAIAKIVKYGVTIEQESFLN